MDSSRPTSSPTGKRPRQNGPTFLLALTGTLLVNIVIVGLLAGTVSLSIKPSTSDSNSILTGQSNQSTSLLCGVQRCPYEEKGMPRREIETGSWDETIEVAVVPRMGEKQFNPKELPKLLKYEQPEKIQDGVNIKKNPEKPKKLKNKKNKPKPAEKDKKKDTLKDLLDAPEDDDPRKRATRLEDLVGQKDGSTHGTGHKEVKGDPALARLTLELQKQMTAPQLIPKKELRKLKTRVTLEISKSGTILSFRIAKSSKNKHFDTAVRQALQRFMPKEGGAKKLPSVPPHVFQAINAKKVKFVFDGSKLHR